MTLIYDDVGSLSLGDNHTKELRESGGEVIPFKPLKKMVLGVPTLQTVANLMGRNHRKLLVVDDKIAFCGGSKKI